MILRRTLQLSMFLAVIGVLMAPGTALADGPFTTTTFVAPGSTPPIPPGIQVIKSGSVKAGTVVESGTVHTVQPMWGCVYNCVHIRNLTYVYDVYHGKGTVAQAYNGTNSPATLHFSISASIANSYSGKTDVGFPLGAATVTAGVGFSVTRTATVTYGYDVTVEPHKTACIGLAMVYKRYNFGVYEDQFIGDTQFRGWGWAENFAFPYFASYYC